MTSRTISGHDLLKSLFQVIESNLIYKGKSGNAVTDTDFKIWEYGNQVTVTNLMKASKS